MTVSERDSATEPSVSAAAAGARPTGHIQVKGARGTRAFYALWRDADGHHQRKLGPAWVKDSGRRTTRGAVRWAARDGRKPEGYLTQADADGLLSDLLAAAPRRLTHPSAPAAGALTLRTACDEWLRWAERDSEVKHSTLGDYRNVCDRICRDLGAATRVAAITTVRLERWISGFKAERRFSPKEAERRRAAGANVRRLGNGTHVHLTDASPRTKRKYIVALNGVMKRAMLDLVIKWRNRACLRFPIGGDSWRTTRSPSRSNARAAAPQYRWSLRALRPR